MQLIRHQLCGHRHGPAAAATLDLVLVKLLDVQLLQLRLQVIAVCCYSRRWVLQLGHAGLLPPLLLGHARLLLPLLLGHAGLLLLWLGHAGLLLLWLGHAGLLLLWLGHAGLLLLWLGHAPQQDRQVGQDLGSAAVQDVFDCAEANAPLYLHASGDRQALLHHAEKQMHVSLQQCLHQCIASPVYRALLRRQLLDVKTKAKRACRQAHGQWGTLMGKAVLE